MTDRHGATGPGVYGHADPRLPGAQPPRHPWRSLVAVVVGALLIVATGLALTAGLLP